MKAQIYNLIILDRSGSMETIKKEAIDGYNETLGTIKAAQLKYLDTQEHFISLAAFCGCGVDMIYDKVPAKDAEKLTADKYDPCCSTPLYDAIGSTCKQMKKHIKDDPNANVVVTIITDGCENSSREWSGKAVKELIENLKEEGWMFSFIGSEYRPCRYPSPTLSNGQRQPREQKICSRMITAPAHATMTVSMT